MARGTRGLDTSQRLDGHWSGVGMGRGASWYAALTQDEGWRMARGRWEPTTHQSPAHLTPWLRRGRARKLTTQGDQGGWEGTAPSSWSPGICAPGCSPGARWRWQGDSPVPGPACPPAGALGLRGCSPPRGPVSQGGARLPASRGQRPGHTERKAWGFGHHWGDSECCGFHGGRRRHCLRRTCRRCRWAEGPCLDAVLNHMDK